MFWLQQFDGPCFPQLWSHHHEGGSQIFVNLKLCFFWWGGGVAYIEGSQTVASCWHTWVSRGPTNQLETCPQHLFVLWSLAGMRWSSMGESAKGCLELLGITSPLVLVALVMGLTVIDNLSTHLCWAYSLWAHWEMLVQRPERRMKLLMLDFARFN